jgi:hypothetical protein
VKKQSKTVAIRTLLTQGKTVADVAKKLKVKPAAVYQVRYRMRKEEQEAREIDPVNTPLAYSTGRGKYAVPEPVQEVVQVFPEDPVNHPPHYKKGGIEVIDFIEAKRFGYHLGNVIKYVSRSQHKGHYLEDLKKAQWYLTRAIEEAQK